MIKLFLTTLFFSQTLIASWVSGDLSVADTNSKETQGIYASTVSGGTSFNSWELIDVTTLGIPTGVKSVFLTGLLIISHGSNNDSCDLTVSLRAFGDTMSSGNYICQAVANVSGGGQRSGCTSWVPVTSDRFEIYIGKNTTTTYPTGCAYGVNLTLQGFLK